MPITPNIDERRRDELMLDVMRLLERAGIAVICGDYPSLADFLAPPTDGDRRAFKLIAGLS